MKGQRALWVVLLAACFTASGLMAGVVAVKNVVVQGEVQGDKAAVIDGIWLQQESDWNSEGTLFWTDLQAAVVFDFGKVYLLENVLLQLDNNDSYELQVSQDGSAYTPWLTVPAEVGEVENGLDILASQKGHRHYAEGLATQLAKARYVRLKALQGDDAYAVAEIEFQGSALAPGSLLPEDRFQLRDEGKKPWVADIEKLTLENPHFRQVLWTGAHMQLTVMSIPAGGEIGMERHDNIDQFIRVEQGQARVVMGQDRRRMSFDKAVAADWIIMVPAGWWHNVFNTGSGELKVYALYAPAEHRPGTLHKTAAEAAADEHHH